MYPTNLCLLKEVVLPVAIVQLQKKLVENKSERVAHNKLQV